MVVLILMLMGFVQIPEDAFEEQGLASLSTLQERFPVVSDAVLAASYLPNQQQPSIWGQ